MKSSLSCDRVALVAMQILLIEDDEKVARAIVTGLEAECLAVETGRSGHGTPESLRPCHSRPHAPKS